MNIHLKVTSPPSNEGFIIECVLFAHPYKYYAKGGEDGIYKRTLHCTEEKNDKLLVGLIQIGIDDCLREYEKEVQSSKVCIK